MLGIRVDAEKEALAVVVDPEVVGDEPSCEQLLRGAEPQGAVAMLHRDGPQRAAGSDRVELLAVLAPGDHADRAIL